jgi:hypothetical protein
MAGSEAISYGPASHAYRRANRGVVSVDRMVTCAKVIALSALEMCARPVER